MIDKNEFRIDITNYNRWPHYSSIQVHKVYELYFLFNGSIYYIIEGNKYEITEGDVVWIPPNIPHFTRPRDTERHKRLVIFISQSFLNKCILKELDTDNFISKAHVFHPQSNSKNLFRRILNFILEEYLSELDYLNTSVQGLFSSLLAQMQRMYDDEISYPQKNENTSSYTHQTTKVLAMYISNNYKEQLTLSLLADQINMSTTYLSAFFKKNMGISFKQYLLNVRIEKARELLSTTNYSVEKIALECGFNSSNHFCKMFKKIMNMPPNMYRSKGLNDN